MIKLSYDSIPAFLHKSAFYQSLNDDGGDNEDIQIPEHCLKENAEVNHLGDFRLLLQTMHFWGIDEIPVGMIRYLDTTEYLEWQSVAVDILDPKSPLLVDILYIFECIHLHCVGSASGRFELAIQKGRVELLDYWLSNHLYSEKTVSGYQLPSESCLACQFGQLDCLRLLYKHSFKIDAMTACYASGCGRLDCLQFIHESNCDWTGKKKVESFISPNGQSELYVANAVCSNAAQNGHLACLRYAHEHGCPIDHYVVEVVSTKGHYNCLEYALKNGCRTSTNATLYASFQGHLECLKLLHQYNAPWNEGATNTAAKAGHLHILQYLHEHHCPWDNSLYESAARFGHLPCIQYARSQGLEWDIEPTEYTDLCAAAAESGDVRTLQYLHESGVQWDENTVLQGVYYKGKATVQYAIEHGCEWDRAKCTQTAASKGDVDMLRYLTSTSLWTCEGEDLQECAVIAARDGNVLVLQYLVEELHYNLNAEGSGKVFTAALANGRFECVRYCFEKGCRRINSETVLKSYFVKQRSQSYLLCEEYLSQQDFEIPEEHS